MAPLPGACLAVLLHQLLGSLVQFVQPPQQHFPPAIGGASGTGACAAATVPGEAPIGNVGWVHVAMLKTTATEHSYASRARWRRGTGIESSCANSAICSRLVAPTTVVVATIATICPEFAATSRGRRCRHRCWRRRRSRRWCWRITIAGWHRGTGIKGSGADLAICSRLVAPTSVVVAAIAAIRPEFAATSGGRWRRPG